MTTTPPGTASTSGGQPIRDRDGGAHPFQIHHEQLPRRGRATDAAQPRLAPRVANRRHGARCGRKSNPLTPPHATVQAKIDVHALDRGGAAEPKRKPRGRCV